MPENWVKEEVEHLYDRIRAKIEHEDNLVNQRIVWMMTLQGLLFTAYGFSLSAEATSLSVLSSNPEAHNMFISTVIRLRQAIVAVGVGSSFAALVGVVAAHRAIRHDARTFHRAIPDDARTLRREQNNCSSDLKKTIPKSPIGQRVTNILGIIYSLVIPFLGGVAWMWVGGFLPHFLIVVIVVIALVLMSVIGITL